MEYRVGELAHLNEIPQTPYYGSVDSTPLFLILMAEHAKMDRGPHAVHELKETVDRAFEWMRKYGDVSGSGYLRVQLTIEGGIRQSGLEKTLEMPIVNADGSLASPPIALVEVQGYVYLAKILGSELYRESGRQGCGRSFARGGP